MSKELTPSIRVGCSGWQYKHWRGDFYPPDLPQSRWLEYYAERFNTVEINNTFYRLPDATTFASWGRRVPRGFVYALKASRYLTHMKKLKDPEGPLELFFTCAKLLGSALGPVLYQLPPRWPLTPVSLARFETFLKALPRRRRHAVEFREPSWYSDEVFALLQHHRVALCLHDMKGSATGTLTIGPFVYVRFHGPAPAADASTASLRAAQRQRVGVGPHEHQETKYSGRYSDAALDAWAEWLAGQVHAGRPIYAYFNNDTGGHAPRDAIRLRERIARLTSLHWRRGPTPAASLR